MSRVVQFMRDLVAKGMSWDDAAAFAERFEDSLDDALALAVAPKRRSAGAERQARYRESKRNGDVTSDVTSDASPSDAISPVPSASPEPPSTTLIPLPSEPKGSSEKTTRARKGPPAAKSRRCPNAWMPSETDVAMARREGFTPGEIDRELAKIRDYEFRDGHSDWDAVFRNWIRKAAENRPRQGKPHERPHPTSAKFAAKQANMERALRGAESAANRRAV